MGERDIVEDLREGATVLDEPFHREEVARTMQRAADEIERLRSPEVERRLRAALRDAIRALEEDYIPRGGDFVGDLRRALGDATETADG